jgi:hypothetical protein
MATEIKIGDRILTIDGQPGKVVVDTAGLFGSQMDIGEMTDEASAIAAIKGLLKECGKSFPGLHGDVTSSAGK